MSWSSELDELARRRELADGLGGAEGIERQHRFGKLTVRERIDRLADAGSFRPFGWLKGDAAYDDDGELQSVLPAGQVDGRIRVDGREAIVMGGDFTVRGGSAGGAHGGLGTELSASERALEWRIPYVRLLDSAGGSVRSFEALGRTYLPDGNTLDPRRRQAAEHRSRRLRRARLGRRPARAARRARPLQRDDEGERPGVPRWSAGRAGGDRDGDHQGGARRARHPRAPERRRRQPRRGRGRRPRPDPPLPVVPPVVGRRAATACADERSRRPP